MTARGGAEAPVRLKPVAHPPTAGFRGHSHDVQSIGLWVDEVTAPERQAKSLNPKELEHEFFRYEAVFNELCAQAAIFSPRFSHLIRRMWKSTAGLLQRLVKAINSVDGQRLRAENEAREAHHLKKMQAEQFMVQLTDMKIAATVNSAAIRERDGQIAANNKLISQMSQEVLRLRSVIGHYIEGQHSHEHQMSRDVLGTLDGPSVDLSEAHLQGPDALKGDLPETEPYDPAAIMKLEADREVGVLDMGDEIDSLFAQVTLEQQRQTKFITDIDQLVSKLNPANLASADIARLHLKTSTASVQTDLVMSAVEAARKPGDAGTGEALDEEEESEDEFAGAVVPKYVEPVEPAVPIPCEIRVFVKTEPHSMRIPSLTATVQTVMSVWIDKLKHDQQCVAHDHPIKSMPHFFHFWLLSKYGLEKLADVHVLQLQSALLHHRKHKRVNLLGRMLGSFNVEAPPPLDTRDVTFLLRILAHFRQTNDLSETVIADGGIIEVNRASAIQSAKTLFGPLLPDNATALVHRYSNNPLPVSKNPKKIDLDDVLSVATKQWVDLNEIWESHLATLFETHCDRYFVKEELRFCLGDMDSRPDHDAVVVSVPPDKRGSMSQARPLRDYERAMSMLDPRSAKAKAQAQAQAKEAEFKSSRCLPPERSRSALTFDEADAESVGSESASESPETSIAEDEHTVDSGGDGQASGPEQDLVELLDFYKFKRLLKQMFPETEPLEDQVDGMVESETFREYRPIPDEQVEALWREGLQLADRRRQADFDKLFERREDDEGNEYWVNLWAKSTQRQAPYDPRKYKSEDLEKHVFITLCRGKELLPKSPFCKLLDRAPADLWRDSDMFLLEHRKELALDEASRREEIEKRKAAAAAAAAAEMAEKALGLEGGGNMRGSAALRASLKLRAGLHARRSAKAAASESAAEDGEEQ